MSSTSSEVAPVHARTFTVALVGNPNAGKTTLFNALSGLRHKVGNYPGVTVDIHKARCRQAPELYLIDVPGTYSLAPRSPDEMLTVNLLLGRVAHESRPDAIVAVVDASNLERHLYLVTQLFELGIPIIVALNMFDVASHQGLRIDVAELERELGVRVVPMQANRGIGIEQLIRAVTKSCATQVPPTPVAFPQAFDVALDSWSVRLPNEPRFLLRRALLDISGSAEAGLIARYGVCLGADLATARGELEKAGCPVPAVEARTRYGWIRQILARAMVMPAKPPVNVTDRIDRVLTHKLWGTLIFLVVMAALFQSIFTVAVPLMDLLNMGQHWLVDLVRGHFPPGAFTSLLADGVIGGVGSVVVFLPQILILFCFLAILEDCGYMARAAFLMDRLMAGCGLSGKSFIPMLSSVACAVPGIMATRVIENRRDRLATILVAPLMSCSARLPLYTLLTAAFFSDLAWWVPGLIMLCMYLIGFVTAPLVALALKRTLLRGPTPLFVLEMPQYQWPNVRSVIVTMLDRAGAFLVNAGTVILASMIVIWALLYYPAKDAQGNSYDVRIAALAQQATPEAEEKINQLNGEWRRQSILGRVGRSIEPVVVPLGWDWKIAMAAMASFPAREVIVGVLGQIYNLGEHDPEELNEPLGEAMRRATWHDEPGGRPVFTIPVALSLMVFFALCCQCVSTLVVIRRETGTWAWPAFTFAYMTALAYLAAMATFQIGSRLI